MVIIDVRAWIFGFQALFVTAKAEFMASTANPEFVSLKQITYERFLR